MKKKCNKKKVKFLASRCQFGTSFATVIIPTPICIRRKQLKKKSHNVLTRQVFVYYDLYHHYYYQFHNCQFSLMPFRVIFKSFPENSIIIDYQGPDLYAFIGFIGPDEDDIN